MTAENTPKEALMQIEIEHKRAEFVERYGLEIGNQVTELFIPVAEKYGKDVADVLSQEKIDKDMLAEKLGLKMRELEKYSFPELENSLINRIRFARDINTEGTICISPKNEKKGNYRAFIPAIEYANTSKELTESMASWMGIKKLPKPQLKKGATLPIYNLQRSCTPAIYLVCLARFGLVKREHIENADKIIEMFKVRAWIRCDENWNPLPFHEPKYITVYRLKNEERLSYEEIAKRLGEPQDKLYKLIYYAKNPELYLKWKQEYRRRRLSKRPTNAD